MHRTREDGNEADWAQQSCLRPPHPGNFDQLRRGTQIEEIGRTARLAGPLVLINISHLAINVVMLTFAASAGTASLAATALALSLFGLASMFGAGVLAAIPILVARELGAPEVDWSRVRCLVQNGLLLAAIIALLTTALLWNSADALRVLRQPPKSAAQAQDILRILLLSLFPLFAYIVLRGVAFALQRTRETTALCAGATVVNAIAGYAFTYGAGPLPELGALGAALGGIVATLFLAAGLAATLLLASPYSRLQLTRGFAPRIAVLQEVWRLGWPIGAAVFLEVSAFHISTFIAGALGQEQLAAHAIAFQCLILSFMVGTAVGQAGSIRVSLAFGRNDLRGVKNSGSAALILVSVATCATSIVIWSKPGWIIERFIDGSDPSAATVAGLVVPLLAVAALVQLADGLQAAAAGILRGLHDTRFAMLAALLGYWIAGIGGGIFLAFHLKLGVLGLWIALGLALLAVSVSLIARWALLVHRPSPRSADLAEATL